MNFYSSGDEVLQLYPRNDIGRMTGITDSWGRYAWHKQELFKGRGIGVGAGATDWSGWNVEENWLGAEKISVAKAREMEAEDFRTNTVFYCYPQSMNSPSIPLPVQGAHLALGIPALTPAAGATEITALGIIRNFDLDNVDENANGILRPNGWPTRANYPGRWLHSDMKDISYYYNYRLYEFIIEKGGVK